MILSLELKNDLEDYITNHLNSLATQFPTITNFNIQDNKYDTEDSSNQLEFRVESIDSKLGLVYLSNVKNISISNSISTIVVNYNQTLDVQVTDTNVLTLNNISDLDYLAEGDIITLPTQQKNNTYIIVDIENSNNSFKYGNSNNLTTLFYINILVGTTNYLEEKENYLLILKEVQRLFTKNIHIHKKCSERHLLVKSNTNRLNVDNTNDKVHYILLTATLTENKLY